MSFISSFDVISAVSCGVEEKEWRRPDPEMFFCIPASAADAAAVNPKGTKTFLAKGLITFLISSNPILSKKKVYQKLLLIISS